VAELIRLSLERPVLLHRLETPGPAARACTRSGISVDVMVPTYNEPEWVVRRTLIGAPPIRYPHQTYLLDDGRRPEMEALAKELGAGYITRPDNARRQGRKPECGDGADHGDFNRHLRRRPRALPPFLDSTLGYFADSTIAFVQTPQEFYNVESFQQSDQAVAEALVRTSSSVLTASSSLARTTGTRRLLRFVRGDAPPQRWNRSAALPARHPPRTLHTRFACMPRDGRRRITTRCSRSVWQPRRHALSLQRRLGTGTMQMLSKERF